MTDGILAELCVEEFFALWGCFRTGGRTYNSLRDY